MGQNKKKATAPRTNESSAELPPAGSDEFAHLVAAYAWEEGLTANAIVRRLDLPIEPIYLMQVKRALKRGKDKFLQLLPLEHEKCQQELSAKVMKKLKRHLLNQSVLLKYHLVFFRLDF